MQHRRQHWPAVRDYFNRHIAVAQWTCTLPGGSGHGTYVVHGAGRTYFAKIGADTRRYQLLASDGLTPEVLADGCLDGGVSILIQPYIAGKTPARRDYQTHLDRVACILGKLHHHSELQQILPAVDSGSYKAAAWRSLSRLRQRWDRYKLLVPDHAAFVDRSLLQLAANIARIDGSGLIASHNDICDANWILAENGRWYLIDLEAMALDDPALDLGALLWWYYPPHMRQQFLQIAGYTDDPAFRWRMQVRMAPHCLHIILPRDNSFDAFDPAAFGAALTDFKAILLGEENPQGYA